jgi:23S rRNA pseudouridine2605 synthase
MATRLNKYIAQNTEYSRRAADDLITQKRVTVNGEPVTAGQQISEKDKVSVDGAAIIPSADSSSVTVILNKPRGYVCSRNGQGSKTIYELLPESLRHLNSVGRLDKDSSGLLLMTSDGELANQLTHPRYQKVKVYEIELNIPLQPLHQQMISDHGIVLEDGISKFPIEKMDESGRALRATLHEGRNRQVRRTFEALGYKVTALHRTVFGPYELGNLAVGQIKEADPKR